MPCQEDKRPCSLAAFERGCVVPMCACVFMCVHVGTQEHKHACMIWYGQEGRVHECVVWVCECIVWKDVCPCGGAPDCVHTRMCTCVCMHIRVRGWKILQRDGAALVWEENIGDWTPWMEFPNLESGWEQVRYV